MAEITINTDALKPRKEWKRHKVTPGDNIHRILPPFGDVDVHKNVPFKKWSVIWGLVDPASGRMRPINSPSNSEERKCPVYDYLELLTNKVEALRKQFEGQGATEDQIKEALAPLNKILWEIKPKHGYAYNAVDQSGVVGILEIKTTAHKAMKKKMMEYINLYSQDPTTLNSLPDDGGVWFNITREGERKDTKYDVIFHQVREKDDQGRLIAVDDRTALPKNVVENYGDLGYDLHKLYKTPTYDELKATLILNLHEWAKDTPALLVEGFTMADMPTAPAQSEAPVEAASIVKGNKPIGISMGDADPDVDDIPFSPTQQPGLQQSAPATQQPGLQPAAVQPPVVQPPVVQQPAPAIQPQAPEANKPLSDDDFMKMANGLLDS